jgi:hypothetical protein
MAHNKQRAFVAVGALVISSALVLAATPAAAPPARILRYDARLDGLIAPGTIVERLVEGHD